MDVLFVDGNHTEEGVRGDFLDYRHLLRPGGIIAFHEILKSQPLGSNHVHRLLKTLIDVHDTASLCLTQTNLSMKSVSFMSASSFRESLEHGTPRSPVGGRNHA